MAFSPDGTLLASASLDFTVKLWDVATHANIATLEHIAEVSSVSFSPDGTLLASASVDGTVRLWDVAKKENIASLEHTDGVRSVAFSPDGTLLASGSLVGTLKLWDVVRREQIASLEGHTDMVFSVAFSPDGTLLTSASKDYTFKLWDVAKKENIATHVTGATSVAFSPDGTILAYGAESEAVLLDVAMLLDVKTKEPIFFFEGYPELIVSVFSSHTDWVLSVSFSPDGTLFASALGDNTIKLWDVSEWTGVSPYHLVKISGDDQEGMPGAVLANPLIVEVRDQDDNPLADVEVTFTVTAGNGKLSGQSTIEHATTDADGRAEAILTLGPILGTNTVGVSLGVRTFATFNAVGVAPYHIATLTGHTDRVESVSFSPDGQTLASGSVDETIRLWDVGTGRVIRTLTGHTDAVWSLSFSPDGQTLASGSVDETIRLWDVGTGRVIRTLTGHTARVVSVSFSPDGQTLASGSEDGTTRLWDVGTGCVIRTLTGHTAVGGNVSFSPDGLTLASGSRDRDRMVLLYDVEHRSRYSHTHRAYGCGLERIV